MGRIAKPGHIQVFGIQPDHGGRMGLQTLAEALLGQLMAWVIFVLAVQHRHPFQFGWGCSRPWREYE